MASCNFESNVQNADVLLDTEETINEHVSDSLQAEADSHNASSPQDQADAAISEDADETWKQELTGSQHSTVEHGNISNYGLVSYYDDWIYFINTENYNLYRINRDGTGMMVLDEGTPTSYLCVSDDSIYFCKEQIYKMDLDGSNKKLVCNTNIECFEVEWDQIYYSNENGIYKIKTDGSDNTLISIECAFSINVSDGWIYYNSCQDGKLYSVTADA